jgi:hypothetical protein
LVAQLPVNKKRMQRLMREPHLLVPSKLRLQAKRTLPRSQTPTHAAARMVGHRHAQGLGKRVWLRGDIVVLLDW